MVLDMDIQKQKQKLNREGYKFSTSQHNGVLYAKIVGNTLFKAFIDNSGNIMRYMPTKANKYQKRIFS